MTPRRSAPRDGTGRVIDQEEAARNREALIEALYAAVAGPAESAIQRTAAIASDSEFETGVYVISVVSQMTGVHRNTLRKYEQVGLLNPNRSEGSHRRYSEEDVARLKLIKNLTEKYELNLAGVRLVMELVSHMHRVLDGMKSSREILRTPEGRTAANRLAALLEALEDG